ncbi:MAG: NAD-dependent epimerase/dehydratase family protein [Micrococcales bacterium]|nr:NAD-dependent epimerase/dehydratase family protein [Micrococcales bacterium]
MRYVLTGAAGFLGYHARARLAVDPEASVTALTRADTTPGALAGAVRDCDVVLHLAGINRVRDGAESELHDGNVALAEQLVEALDAAQTHRAPPTVIYAGSTQADAGHAGADSPYGRGKREAGAVLGAWGERAGASVVELRFPGLFGEHGRPDYNSFVATFADRIVHGRRPVVSGDRSLPLLPVGAAVAHLLAAAGDRHPGQRTQHPQGTWVLISEIAEQLCQMHDTYAVTGDIPALTSAFDIALFNTLRAAMWPQAYPLRPQPRVDERGTLVETVRVHGGGGQAFVSTTNPGYRRGDHVHFTKIERFQVLSGRGLIRLRKMLTDQIIEFAVTGDEPAVIDMPTLWTHSIENVGTEPLVTAFWANELFDPQRPDTYPLAVLDGPDRPTPHRDRTTERPADERPCQEQR